jgi:tetratricopeptide (TPR) repeat protein
LTKLEPANAGHWNSRCWARAIVGKELQEAVADCNESLRLRPGDAETFDSRGFAYLKLGDFEKSIADYDAALKIDPKKAYSLYGRGFAKQKKGDQADGDADMSAAKAIRADIADIFTRYGVK